MPEIAADTDAAVRVDTVTISGTGLHIIKGDVSEVTPGRTLGHEAVGTVEPVGNGVKNVKVGDRVLVSCITHVDPVGSAARVATVSALVVAGFSVT